MLRRIFEGFINSLAFMLKNTNGNIKKKNDGTFLIKSQRPKKLYVIYRAKQRQNFFLFIDDIEREQTKSGNLVNSTRS